MRLFETMDLCFQKIRQDDEIRKRKKDHRLEIVFEKTWFNTGLQKEMKVCLDEKTSTLDENLE